ncbi:ftsH Extracellular family protein [Neisseria meningitidis NM151]|nr:ftsH Extracellular family protein [Neisseria meningitidis NM151]
MGNTFKSILVWVALGIGLMAAFNALDGKKEDNGQIEYSQFIQQVNNGEVSGVNIEGSVVSGYLIKGERTDKSTFFTNAPLDDNLIKTLLDGRKTERGLFYSLLPVLLLIGAWFYFMRMQTGGGGKGGAFSFGKSRARLLDKDANKVTFADVAGCDEAKEEVQEIVDYLKAPNLSKLGRARAARHPAGGQPGYG